MADGSQGWDEYAPFYDWENARTVARRDVADSPAADPVVSRLGWDLRPLRRPGRPR